MNKLILQLGDDFAIGKLLHIQPSFIQLVIGVDVVGSFAALSQVICVLLGRQKLVVTLQT